MRRSLLTLTLVAFSSACLACAEEPAPEPPPPPPPPAAPRIPPPDPTCDRVCDRAMSCELSELGDRRSCMRRCFARASRDAEALRCLAEPTPDGSRRCDLARRCVEVTIERAERPEAITPERGRLDARALGTDVEISLEARLIQAIPEASRYDLVLLLRGRASGEEAPAAAEAPALWVRIGGFTSDGRLPLLRVRPSEPADPSAPPDPSAPLFEHASYWAGSGDSYRVRVVRGELLVEHAFEDEGLPSGGATNGFRPSLRIALARGARVRAERVLVE